VYAQNPGDMNHLNALIEEEFTSLNDNIESCQAICRSVANRCQMCINTEGRQFEHLTGVPGIMGLSVFCQYIRQIKFVYDSFFFKDRSSQALQYDIFFILLNNIHRFLKHAVNEQSKMSNFAKQHLVEFF
jgi:hypothetical protein